MLGARQILADTELHRETLSDRRTEVRPQDIRAGHLGMKIAGLNNSTS